MGTVKLAISTIGATLVLEGHDIRNPIKDPDGKLILPLRHLLQSHRNSDLVAKKEISVLIELSIAVADLLHDRSPKHRKMSQLINIAFCYLLRVVEYANPKIVTRTVQF